VNARGKISLVDEDDLPEWESRDALP